MAVSAHYCSEEFAQRKPAQQSRTFPDSAEAAEKDLIIFHLQACLGDGPGPAIAGKVLGTQPDPELGEQGYCLRAAPA